MLLSAVSVERHRMGTDGEGIRTLIITEGCTLRCKYCFNKEAWNGKIKSTAYTAEQLYEKIKIDELYFKSTNGGITFGGGEPMNYAGFIHEFHEKYPMLSIVIETSLNCSWEQIQKIAEDAEMWIIDIKDMKNYNYHAYTDGFNTAVINNLKDMVKSVLPEKIHIRVPLIPDYNTRSDVRYSISKLKKMGFVNIEKFEYMVD